MGFSGHVRRRRSRLFRFGHENVSFPFIVKFDFILNTSEKRGILSGAHDFQLTSLSVASLLRVPSRRGIV